MKPIEFKGQTKILLRPGSMTDEECESLAVFSDGKICLSCWKMGFKERLKALIFGKIWVWIHSGETQPPIALECCKNVFEKEKDND